MGLSWRSPVLAATASVFALGAAEGLYAGGGLTILSMNDLDGRHSITLLLTGY
jgi:hypothetical protein